MALEFKRTQKDAEPRIAALQQQFADAGIKAKFSVDWDAISKDPNKTNIAKWCTYETQFNLYSDISGVWYDDLGKEAFNETFDNIVFSASTGKGEGTGTAKKDGKTLRIHYSNPAWASGDGYGELSCVESGAFAKEIEKLLG